jgi:hypothetical protein
MKRTKNSRYMHMVFNVQSGTVEVKVHENEFTLHRQGVWQVPRGMLSFLLVARMFLFVERREWWFGAMLSHCPSGTFTSPA